MHHLFSCEPRGEVDRPLSPSMSTQSGLGGMNACTTEGRRLYLPGSWLSATSLSAAGPRDPAPAAVTCGFGVPFATEVVPKAASSQHVCFLS